MKPTTTTNTTAASIAIATTKTTHKLLVTLAALSVTTLAMVGKTSAAYPNIEPAYETMSLYEAERSSRRAKLKYAPGEFVGSVFAGAAGGALVGIPAAYLGATLAVSDCTDSGMIPGGCGWAALGGGILGAGIGLPTGAALGVIGYGAMMDREGSKIGAVVGSSAGMTAAIAANVLLASAARDGMNTGIAVTLLAVLPAVGSTIGYSMGLHDRGPQRTGGALIDRTPGLGIGASVPTITPLFDRQTRLVGGQLRIAGGTF